MTLEREIDRFCERELARGTAPGTVQRYRQHVRELNAFLGGRGKDDLREANEDDIVDFLLFLEEKKGLRKTTITLVFWRLRRLFAHLHNGAVLLGNPASALNRKRYPSRMRDWLTEDEVEQLLEMPDPSTAIGLRDRAVLEVLYGSGLRISELRRLTLDDVDLGAGLVAVQRSKNGCFRRVPLGKLAVASLARYLQQARPRLCARRELAVAASPILFLSEAGTPLHKNSMLTAIRTYAKATGIKKTITPHVLRHTFAIHLLRHGASTRHIQAMLGHRHLESTQVYARLVPGDLKRVHARCHPRERHPGMPQKR